MALIGGQVRLGAALGILIPCLRQEEAPVERTAAAFRGGRERDPDLATPHLAQGARVLARDADRAAPRLEEAGVVDDHDERRDHAPRQALSDRLPLPGALVHELLKALLVAVGQAHRHGLDRLATPVEHETAQVGLTPATLVASRQ
ncbi:MAG TPA: hypothetical protein PLT83_06225 [Thermoleophilia bacterium]|nr:hypothetical protein [Thermoleophilia bacterium]